VALLPLAPGTIIAAVSLTASVVAQWVYLTWFGRSLVDQITTMRPERDLLGTESVVGLDANGAGYEGKS
jgi:hypothetical protein